MPYPENKQEYLEKIEAFNVNDSSLSIGDLNKLFSEYFDKLNNYLGCLSLSPEDAVLVSFQNKYAEYANSRIDPLVITKPEQALLITEKVENQNFILNCKLDCKVPWTYTRYNLLLLACCTGNDAFVDKIISTYPEMIAGSVFNLYSPLYVAINHNMPHLIDKLVTHDYSILFNVYDKMSPIGLAARMGYLECVKVLHELGSPLEVNELDELPPVYYAVYYNHVDVLEYLGAQGVDITKEIDGHSLFYYIKMSLSPEAYRYRSRTPLFRFLLDRGLAFNSDQEKIEMMQELAYHNDLSALQLFFDRRLYDVTNVKNLLKSPRRTIRRKVEWNFLIFKHVVAENYLGNTAKYLSFLLQTYSSVNRGDRNFYRTSFLNNILITINLVFAFDFYQTYHDSKHAITPRLNEDLFFEVMRHRLGIMLGFTPDRKDIFQLKNDLKLEKKFNQSRQTVKEIYQNRQQRLTLFNDPDDVDPDLPGIGNNVNHALK